MKAGIIGNSHASFNQHQNVPKPDKIGGKPKWDPYENPIDRYTPTLEGTANPSAIRDLWNETNHAAQAIRKLVASMLGNGDASGQGFWAVRAGGTLQLSEADRAQAQQMVSEDGFFGVRQTTDRIMGFAKALVGEDASDEQIENMRAAVQKGFDIVARMFGGFDKLPQVTKDTYEAIMKAFDEWKAGGSESAA